MIDILYIKALSENAFTNWVHNDIITFHDVKIIVLYVDDAITKLKVSFLKKTSKC